MIPPPPPVADSQLCVLFLVPVLGTCLIPRGVAFLFPRLGRSPFFSVRKISLLNEAGSLFCRRRPFAFFFFCPVALFFFYMRLESESLLPPTFSCDLSSHPFFPPKDFPPLLKTRTRPHDLHHFFSNKAPCSIDPLSLPPGPLLPGRQKFIGFRKARQRNAPLSWHQAKTP